MLLAKIAKMVNIMSPETRPEENNRPEEKQM